MKTTTRATCLSSSLLGCVAGVLACGSAAIAGVGSGNFTHGSGQIVFDPATNTYNIVASNGAIIQYSNFDIPAGHTVQFLQPGVHARVLNRVISADPTQIDGNLFANGIVYLTNPSGIVFGPTSFVKVGGIYAAAADLTDSRFLNGVDLFIKPENPVVNFGTIAADRAVHLIGRHVANHGHISVLQPNGIVTMSASDDSVFIGSPGSHYLVTLTTNPHGINHGGIGVENTGTITTGAGGRIRLGAGDVYSLAIQVSGHGISAGTVNFDSPTFVADDTTVTGNTYFAFTVDTSPGAASSKLLIQGNAEFLGTVGGLSPLSSLEVTGDAAIGAGTITTDQDQVYHGDVTLLDDAALISLLGDLHLHSLVHGQGHDLDLTAHDTFIGGEVSDVGNLTTSGSGSVHIGADITTLQSMTFNNAVQLDDTVTLLNLGSGDIAFMQTIDGPFGLTVINENGDVIFGGNVGETAALDSLETVVGGTIVFDATLVQVVNDLLLNHNVDLVGVPAIATIGAGGDLQLFSLQGDIVMGQNQKLTVLGDLVMQALNGSITLGDLNALGDISVNANAILLLTREPGQVMMPDGSFVMDGGLDFVAGGQFFFSVAPVLLGSGPAPVFMSAHGNPDAMGTLGAYEIIANMPLATTQLRLPSNVFLDLMAMQPAVTPGPGPGPGPEPAPGAPDVNLAIAFAHALDDPDTEEIEESVIPDATEREGLARLGILARLAGAQALIDYVEGRGVYIDVPDAGFLARDIAMAEVTIDRIQRRHLGAALARLDRIVHDVRIDAETGEITAVLDRTPAVRNAFGQSWSQYRAERGDDASAAAFAAYLAESGATREHNTLLALRDLAIDLQALGLTRAEARIAMNVVLAPMQPENMSAEDLRRAVFAAR